MDEYNYDDKTYNKPKTGIKDVAKGLLNPLLSLLGTGGGLLLGSLQARSIAAQQENTYFTNLLRNSSVEPSYYAKTGGIMQSIDGATSIPVQGELGENMAMPSGIITDLKAKKLHKDEEKETVTDMVPVGSFVATEKMKLKKEEADKILLSRSAGIYSEGDDEEDVKEVRLSSIFGDDKEISAVEALKRVKKILPIPRQVKDRSMDPFALKTAEENILSRGKYIEGIVEMISNKDSSFRKLKKAILT